MLENKENGKMKAVVHSSYGSPDVLELKEVEKPTPTDDEVLIKVYASSINVEDLDYLKGTSWAVRMLGLFKPKYKVLGFDVAGKIEDVGKNVTQFKVGDEVMGDLFGFGLGGFAEYVCAPEKALMLKSSKMAFGVAAAVPSRAILAVQGLCGKRPIQSNQKVLINGAGGGVGPFAVQIAKYLGAQVTAVDNSTKLDMLRSIGADSVIDYTQQDFTKNGETYDIIFDTVVKSSFSRCKNSLTKHGVFLVTVPSLAIILQMLWTSIKGGKKLMFGGQSTKTEDLLTLKELIETGKIKPIIDISYPLEQIVEANRYVDAEHKKGNVIINLEI